MPLNVKISLLLSIGVIAGFFYALQHIEPKTTPEPSPLATGKARPASNAAASVVLPTRPGDSGSRFPLTPGSAPLAARSPVDRSRDGALRVDDTVVIRPPSPSTEARPASEPAALLPPRSELALGTPPADAAVLDGAPLTLIAKAAPEPARSSAPPPEPEPAPAVVRNPSPAPEALDTAGNSAARGTYVVQGGDTLTKVSRRVLKSDSPDAMRRMLDANPQLKGRPDRIFAGMTLNVPDAATGPRSRELNSKVVANAGVPEPGPRSEKRKPGARTDVAPATVVLPAPDATITAPRGAGAESANTSGAGAKKLRKTGDAGAVNVVADPVQVPASGEARLRKSTGKPTESGARPGVTKVASLPPPPASDHAVRRGDAAPLADQAAPGDIKPPATEVSNGAPRSMQVKDGASNTRAARAGTPANGGTAAAAPPASPPTAPAGGPLLKKVSAPATRTGEKSAAKAESAPPAAESAAPHSDAGAKPPKKTARPATYAVQPNDSLKTIAARVLNDPNRWREIASLNGIKEPGRIAAGTVLKLPGETSRAQ